MKRQLRWHEDQQIKLADNDNFDFTEAIDTEREYIRSFFTSLYQDQAA